MQNLDLSFEEQDALNHYALMNGVRGEDWQEQLADDWRDQTGCYRGLANSPHCAVLDRLHWTHGEHILRKYKPATKPRLVTL